MAIILLATAREESRATKSRRYSQRIYFMEFYMGTDREIRVGDRVRVIGECDAIDFGDDGRLGTVRIVGHWPHSAGVEFDEFDGIMHSLGGMVRNGYGYYLYRSNLRYIGEDVAVSVSDEDVARKCRYCNCEITPDMKLGARLFRDTPICDRCAASRIGEVHSYHFGKGLKYAYAKDKITLGCEIEIDDRDDDGDRDAVINDVIRCARDNKYALIMSHESDGSLDGYGFENVTAPLTIDEWRSDEVREQIRTLIDSAYDNGFAFDEYDHAGLHVHIGRKDLCGNDRAKSDAVGLLMGWSVSRLWSKGFEELSRRNNTEYTHLYDEYGRGKNGLYDTPASECDRYYAVNIENSKTIELRIFKGARSLEDVLVAVDVCYMLAKWAVKKINAFNKRGSYSAKAHRYDDALEYADRITWSALVKYSKFPEVTLPAMREAGINI